MAVVLRPTRGGIEAGLDDFLDNWDPDDPQAIAEWEERYGDVDEDLLTRFEARGTQNRQDFHLRLFIKSMRAYNVRLDQDYKNLSDDEVVDKEIRNASKEVVLKNLRLYLRDALFFMRGRRSQDARPRFKSLVHHRDSMIFWIRRFMPQATVPTKWEIINAANQTLQRLARRWGVNRERHVKTYFGHHELRQLIDFDTVRSPYMPVTESHHLAWCLALICGVRPGSIGRARFYPEQFLAFREVKVFRGWARASFNAKITFLYLKGNRDLFDDTPGLTFTVNGATVSDNLPVSVPHRLLIMLLRRGGLQDHDSLESLLNGDEHEINIKESFMDQPVCRAAGQRGLSISEEPVSGEGLTTFLSQHAINAGYPLGITMYCWRRKAATNWMRQVGTETTRLMMSHDPSTHTLEKYYDQGLFDQSVFEMAMQQDTTISKATMTEEASEVLYRMVDAKRLTGAFVERRVQELLNTSNEYMKARDENDLRKVTLLEQRARRIVKNVLHDERKRLDNSKLRQDEMQRRIEALQKPGELVSRIRNAAKKKLKEQAQSVAPTPLPERSTIRTTTAASSQPQSRDRELEELLEDRDLEAEDLFDAEDDIVNAEDPPAAVSVNSDPKFSWDEEREETEEEFAAAVEVFMLELGKERFHIPDKLYCDLCRNSPYRSEEDKDKVWPSKAKLKNHQLGKPHSKEGEASLKLQFLKEQSGSTKFKCPYGDCKGEYNTIEKLRRHIKKSGPPKPDDNWEDDVREALQRHDDEKRADGWYDEDFEYEVEKKKASVVNANRRRNLGLKYTNEKELDGPTEVSVKNEYKAVVGDGDGALMTEIPEHYQAILAFGDDGDEYAHPAVGQGPVVATGNEDDDGDFQHPSQVPEHKSGVIERGDEGVPFVHPGLWMETFDT